MADPFFVLKDFGSYSMAQRRIDADYADRDKWNRMAVINTAMSGVFSSDRTIREYNDTIWHLDRSSARYKLHIFESTAEKYPSAVLPVQKSGAFRAFLPCFRNY